jgi:hypothetical protein
LGPSRRGSGKARAPKIEVSQASRGQTSDPGNPRTWGMQADQRMCSAYRVDSKDRNSLLQGYSRPVLPLQGVIPGRGVGRECDGWALVIGIDVQCQPLAACALRGTPLFQGMESFGVSKFAFALVSTLANGITQSKISSPVCWIVCYSHKGVRTRNVMARHGKAAGKSVKSAMHREKRGTLCAGKGGRRGKVTSRKQAIAMGPQESSGLSANFRA